MRELASESIGALALVPEGMAPPSSIEHFGRRIRFADLVLPMGELAFVPIWTVAHLRKVFTHLGFVFGLIDSLIPFLPELFLGTMLVVSGVDPLGPSVLDRIVLQGGF